MKLNITPERSRGVVFNNDGSAIIQCDGGGSLTLSGGDFVCEDVPNIVDTYHFNGTNWELNRKRLVSHKKPRSNIKVEGHAKTRRAAKNKPRRVVHLSDGLEP